MPITTNISPTQNTIPLWSIEEVDGMRVYRANPPCPDTDIEFIIKASAFTLQVIEAFPEKCIDAVLACSGDDALSFLQEVHLNDTTKLVILVLDAKDEAAMNRLAIYITMNAPNMCAEKNCVLELPQSVAESIVANQPRFEDVIDLPTPIKPVIASWEHYGDERTFGKGSEEWTGVRGIFSEETQKTQKVKFIGTPPEIADELDS